MFENFPKIRTPLPKNIEEIYSEYFLCNREGRTPASFLSQKMESWLHRQVAKDIPNLDGSANATLELGAGTLNQLPYESSVNTYDIVEPRTDLYNESDLKEKVRNFYQDVSEVPRNQRYNRITSIATLEHICNLPEVVARSGLLLADGGSFRASIPSEGTFLWTLGWMLTTGLEFRLKYGINYRILVNHEHINTSKEIEKVLKYFFRSINCKVFGFCKSMSFYQFYDCHCPEIDKCISYLKNIGCSYEP